MSLQATAGNINEGISLVMVNIELDLTPGFVTARKIVTLGLTAKSPTQWPFPVCSQLVTRSVGQTMNLP